MPEFESAQRAGGDEAARSEVAARSETTGSTSPAAAAWQLARTPVKGDPAAPSRRRLSRGQVLALQRAVGNRATTGLVRPVAQRVAIKDPTMTETLYNKSSASGQATAGKFQLTPRYGMTRQGDRGVTVTVRIMFLSQKRNTIDPTSPGASPNTPPLGTLLDYPAEIPANDPRVGWAKKTAEDAAQIWNGRLTFVGEERNLFSANTTKHLPVTFEAVAVFGPSEQADSVVIVHPDSTVAGAPGQPIDAGNWYKNKGTHYAGDDKVIAAHEYGHLLGIADEYSQSNEQLNALIHQAAPSSAPSAGAALDRATVERMVRSSLMLPLLRQLDVAMLAVTDALRAARPRVMAKMGAAAQAGVVSPDVRDSLRSQLELASEARLAPNIPAVVAFETVANFSSRAQAGHGIDAGFSEAALAKQIRDAYWQALVAANPNRVVEVAGLGAVSINLAASVDATTAEGGVNAAAAAAEAAAAIGPAADEPGLPPVIPPTSLEGQLTALPATWAAAGSLLETGVTPALFETKMLAILKSAGEAAAVPLPAGVAPPPKLASQQALFQRAYAMVSNAAAGASQQLAADLVSSTMKPTLQQSVTDLQARVRSEVNRIMTTPPAGVAALGPADPKMTAMVAAMKKILDADKAGTKGTGRDPLGSGVAAPDQDVTYSYQGMMGTNATRGLRPDQFQPMVNKFNKKLTKTFEKNFHGEVK
jgi:hypothetical protein